jgi:hypothetical protein
MKNIKTTLFSTLFIGVSIPSFGQNVEYQTESKTHNLSPIKVSLSFLNMEQILTPITVGIMVEGHLKDKLFYTVHFRQGYIRNFTIPKDNLVTTQKESKGTVIEVGADWVFADKIKPGLVKIATSISYNGSGTSENYFKAKCDVRKYWALSGGLYEYIRPKYVNSDSSEYIISGNQNIKAPQDKFTSFNLNTVGIYVGLVHRKIKKPLVTTGGTRYRTFHSTKFYAQALIGATKVGNFIYNNQSMKVDNAKQVPLGYRLGWQWDQKGVVTGFEFGKMPGVNLETPVAKGDFDKIGDYLNYVRFTFHFNIYNGDKNYALK